MTQIREENKIVSKLSFVDLAGSERVDLTQNKGERLNEGSNINKSLLTLGCVIKKLSKSKVPKFIPYRDSKLTRLLKDSLGGNSKTMLIVCITPKEVHYEETCHSLNYAAKAKNIINAVRHNVIEITPEKSIPNSLNNSIYSDSESAIGESEEEDEKMFKKNLMIKGGLTEGKIRRTAIETKQSEIATGELCRKINDLQAMA